MMHHSVSKVVVYLRTAQLTGLLVNFLLWESVLKKKGGGGGFSSGDSLRMTYNHREGASNRMTEWFHCRGKTCSGPAGSQYSVRWPTKHSTMFVFLRHLLDYLCLLCTSAEEGVLRNAQQKLGHHVCQGGGGWDTHAVAAMWTFHPPYSPLTHSLTPSPWLCAAPVHLRTGRPGAEDAGRLRNQAEEAGLQRSAVAPGDDHGAAEGLPGAQWHRDQGVEITHHMSRPKTQRESCCWLRLADFSLPTHQPTFLF